MIMNSRLVMKIILLLHTFTYINSKFEPFISGGQPVTYKKWFPHTVHLSIQCKGSGSWVCGGSVVTNRLVLTAAQCTTGCWQRPVIVASTDSVFSHLGWRSKVKNYQTHPHFDHKYLMNDIALLLLRKPNSFDSVFQRVALMESPPYFERAFVAGWGSLQRGEEDEPSEQLYFSRQKVYPLQTCKELLGDSLYMGTLCAERKDVYTTTGDAGSSLVVRGYIQLGLVSFRAHGVRKSVTVYTDNGYFINWILTAGRNLLCSDRNKV